MIHRFTALHCRCFAFFFALFASLRATLHPVARKDAKSAKRSGRASSFLKPLPLPIQHPEQVRIEGRRAAGRGGLAIGDQHAAVRLESDDPHAVLLPRHARQPGAEEEPAGFRQRQSAQDCQIIHFDPRRLDSGLQMPIEMVPARSIAANFRVEDHRICLLRPFVALPELRLPFLLLGARGPEKNFFKRFGKQIGKEAGFPTKLIEFVKVCGGQKLRMALSQSMCCLEFLSRFSQSSAGKCLVRLSKVRAEGLSRSGLMAQNGEESSQGGENHKQGAGTGNDRPTPGGRTS